MHEAETRQKMDVYFLGLSALGIVFGDIGTSPLYTYKTVLLLTGGSPDVHTILGSVSLILWTLILIAAIKYISLAMRMDNDGEGGILALMSLLGGKLKPRPMVLVIGLMGAALIYGDGAITPAISVLSALEGIKIISPELERYILPTAVMILLLLFAIQPKGTAKIGRAFGPVMALWFLTIGILGVWGIIQHPTILLALNPMYGLSYLFSHGMTAFFVLSGVFLCVTGAEALYADMGHFGASIIRRAWFILVLPSLLLNYMGQAAIVLEGASITNNIFYMLCPKILLVPVVMLATVATIIASQSIITGAFTMTRQAIQMGCLPRLKVTQTSATGYGQIYVGITNWLLMLATIGLTIGFGKSDNLAAAYGIAVSGTMLLTSTLLFIALREIWHWNLWKAAVVAGFFIIIDLAFFSSNLTKFANGGYIPIIFAILIFGVMYIWHRGHESICERLKDKDITIDSFFALLKKYNVPRVSNTAVFLTRRDKDIPPIMVWHVKRNHVLQSHVIILNIITLSMPWCKENERLKSVEVAPNMWRVFVSYGFMEQPNIPKVLKKLRLQESSLDLKNVTYYLGRETLIPRDNVHLLPNYMDEIFSFLHRNALPISDYLHLPPDLVLEIGRQVDI